MLLGIQIVGRVRFESSVYRMAEKSNCFSNSLRFDPRVSQKRSDVMFIFRWRNIHSVHHSWNLIQNKLAFNIQCYKMIDLYHSNSVTRSEQFREDITIPALLSL